MPVNTDLIDELVKATEEVFETMVFKKLTTGAPIDGDALRPRSNVVGLVGNATGAHAVRPYFSMRNVT